VRPTRTDDDTWLDRLDTAVLAHEFDVQAVRSELQLRRRDPRSTIPPTDAR
jgi:hypothetical protein